MANLSELNAYKPGPRTYVKGKHYFCIMFGIDGKHLFYCAHDDGDGYEYYLPSNLEEMKTLKKIEFE